MKLRQLRCPPAAFTGNQLITVGRAFLRAHQDRLHKTLGADGIGKFGQPVLVKAATWLPRARIDPFDWQLGQTGNRRGRQTGFNSTLRHTSSAASDSGTRRRGDPGITQQR